MVNKKRKEMERSGRKLERELFRSTLQHSGSATERKHSASRALSLLQGSPIRAPTTPSAPPEFQLTQEEEKMRLRERSSPPRELGPLGVTETGADILSMTSRIMGGDRLRQKINEREEKEKEEQRERVKARKQDTQQFLLRQDRMAERKKQRLQAK